MYNKIWKMSFLGKYFVLLVVSMFMVFCTQFDSGPPFPVDNNNEWRQYLQGVWRHTSKDTVRFGNSSVSTDSSSYQLFFRGDSLRVVRKELVNESLFIGSTLCAVEYNFPNRVNVESCNSAEKYRVWTKDMYNYNKGDTIRINSTNMNNGSPESRSMAEDVSEAIPVFQTTSVDSLRVLYSDGSGFYLTRQQS